LRFSPNQYVLLFFTDCGFSLDLYGLDVGRATACAAMNRLAPFLPAIEVQQESDDEKNEELFPLAGFGWGRGTGFPGSLSSPL
jgi:hypothetical protein